MNRDYLWIQVCEQLKWHNKNNDRCIDTLNRAWGKNTKVRSKCGEVLMKVPVLTEDMLSVSLEQWSLAQLVDLDRPHQRKTPEFFAPIIILDWFNQFFLIDGNTRVNFWNEKGNQGPHAVLRIFEVKRA